MESLISEHSGADVLYLSRTEVIGCCAGLDLVAIATGTLKAHAKGNTTIPAEAYLGWETSAGEAARSLAMPGEIRADGRHQVGLKIINASLGNTTRGLPRSQGFTMILDPETARPLIIMEAAYISSLRTAAVAIVAAQQLGKPGLSTAALLGCGTLAKAHLALLPGSLATLQRVHLFDLDRGRAEALAAAIRADPVTRGLEAVVTDDARACVRGADLVITVTTVTEGYLPFAWLEPGALVVHVSLDDVLPDVVARADLVLVDDWSLVSHDNRRLLGRMYRDGTLLNPAGGHHPEAKAAPGARAVDGTLGEVLLGVRPGRRTDAEVILVNPFGMSILDVAFGTAVFENAVARGLGRRLPI